MSGIKGPGSTKDPRSESTPGYVGLGCGGGGGPAAQGGGVGKRNGITTLWAPRAGGPGAWGLAQSREVVLPCPTAPSPHLRPLGGDAWEHSQKTCSPPGLAWAGGRCGGGGGSPGWGKRWIDRGRPGVTWAVLRKCWGSWDRGREQLLVKTTLTFISDSGHVAFSW